MIKEEQSQIQIRELCRLNMPNGLKELMCDISREVLRAQPPNINKFIASYLSALLVTRDNLSITAQMCNHLCECDCETTLLGELQNIGLCEDDLEVACDVIMNYISKANVNEGNLISVLMKKTEINPSKFPDILNAVRAAYLRQQALNATKDETSVSGDDEIENARAHTLSLYLKAKPTKEMYEAAADKIKFSYRAYGVKRITQFDINQPNEKAINFDDFEIDHIGMASVDSSISEDLKNELALTVDSFRNRISTASSISVAGSFCPLPKHKPYNVHDTDYLSDLVETPEKENINIDYTARRITSTSNSNDTKIYSEMIDSDDETRLDKNENVDEIIDEYVTILSTSSDDVKEVIEELRDKSDQSSSESISDDEIFPKRFDLDDYAINDNANKIEEDNDILNKDLDTEENDDDAHNEVLLKSDFYDPKEASSMSKP